MKIHSAMVHSQRGEQIGPWSHPSHNGAIIGCLLSTTEVIGHY